MEDNDPGAGPFLTPGAWLAEFIKRTTTYCYIQNMKALGRMISEKKIFLCFSHDAPGTWPVWTPGAGFIKKTTIECYIQNMKALGRMISEKKIFLCFSHDAPGAWPVWTPGAGLIKRTTIQCYIQNLKALGLVVSEKIFLCFSYCKSMGAKLNDPWGGAIFDPRGMVGRIYEEDHYTLQHVHIKYESSGPCSFGEDFFMFFQ